MARTRPTRGIVGHFNTTIPYTFCGNYSIVGLKMKKIYHALAPWFPKYPVSHLLIATIMNVVVSALLVLTLYLFVPTAPLWVAATALPGLFFYAGREFRDWEKGHNFASGRFDQKGFWWPVLPSAAMESLLWIARIVWIGGVVTP